MLIIDAADTAHSYGEEADVATQIQRPSGVAVDSVGNRLPAWAVPVKVAMFQFDTRAGFGLRSEAHLDLTGPGLVGF
jgi:hypothetical protein